MVFNKILKLLGASDEKNDKMNQSGFTLSEANRKFAEFQHRHGHIARIHEDLIMAEERFEPSQRQKERAVELIGELSRFNLDLMEFTSMFYLLAVESSDAIEELEANRAIKYSQALNQPVKPIPVGTARQHENASTHTIAPISPTPAPQMEKSAPVQPPQADLPTTQEMADKPMPEPTTLEEWKAQNLDAKPWKIAAMSRKFKVK